MCCMICFFFKQNTAYEVRISDWSSDVCSSDLLAHCGQCRNLRNVLALVECLGGIIDHHSRRGEPRRHIREAEPDRLMVDNGLAESLALAGAARRFLERSDAHPERVAGNRDAAGMGANKIGREEGREREG